MNFKLALACTVIGGAAVGFALPGGPLDIRAGSDGTGAFAPDRQQLMAVNQPVAEWHEGPVFERADDGHFYADVRVEETFLRMMVDTGASVVALTGDDAEAIGLTWRDEDVRPVAQGAGGVISGVAATIPAMSLGGYEASGVRAVIIPEGLEVSLLGQSFLSTIGQVRIEGKRMVLGS